jgi:hypothetical protein
MVGLVFVEKSIRILPGCGSASKDRNEEMITESLT